ncbi:hypothetical protein [Mycoplasmopsis cynos]|uniref:hypothetical protein n=1 Tax=Mycoplasmopsis cynos TaxID=171284 RepID=UPI002201EE4D|nr:hypothetical protein [Mycoplasmopsis cynos]UWV81724.1 hypothetical protein NW065_00980 [Mycoplasmopsis cynos]
MGETNEYVDVVVVYESSSKTKIPDNKQPHDSDRTLIEEIQVDRFRIWLKD